MLYKIKQELEEEFCIIDDYKDDCEHKQTILQINTSGSKLTQTAIISTLALIPSMIGSISIIGPIVSELPFQITTAMCVASLSSIAIGFIGQAIITTISKNKMKKFTNTKTNEEILEEMMHYEMEIAKSKNKKEILRNIYKSIESKEQILSDYSLTLNQIDKYAKLNDEDLEKRQEALSKAYNEKIEQLDILTSQEYLKNKFKSNRKKSQRISNIITSSLIMSLPFCFLIGMPLSLELMKNSIINLESFIDLVKYLTMCFSPTLIAAPLSSPYFIKKNKDFLNAFNNLNQSLGENALSEKPNVEYEEELKYMISAKIGEIVELGMELKEIGYAIKKRNLEKITINEDKSKSKEDILFKDLPEIHITEETRRDVLEHPERYSSCDPRIRMGMFYTDEEKERYLEESLSKPIPNEKEKGRTLVKKKEHTKNK